MIDFDIAQQRLIAAGVRPQYTESVALAAALGRVIANDIMALINIPPADNSAMDGYALCFSDYEEGKALPLQAPVYAGDVPSALKAGHAMRLFTGSLIPDGADTVVIQENCTVDGEFLLINESPREAQHVRYAGEDMEAGSLIIPAGTLLNSGHIAMLASQGLTQLDVYAKPKVGILTTGNELVAPGNTLKEGQIYNSNAPMLASLAAQMQIEVIHNVHAKDTLEDIQKALETLTQHCDVVLTVGGVSVGDKDLVKPAIEGLGGEMTLWRVRMKPGKPVALAHLNNTPIVGLPGNPVSSFAVFILMVTPLLRVMQGRNDILPPMRYGKLVGDSSFSSWREDFIRVQASAAHNGDTTLQPHPQQFSNIISSLAWATGFARIPADTTVNPGDTVAYYALEQWVQ